MKAGGGGGATAAPGTSVGAGDVGHGVGHGGGHGAGQQAGLYDDECVWQQPARTATVNATNNVRMRQIMLPSPN